MKFLIMLLPMVLFSWSFTENDFDRLNKEQVKVIDTSYHVGNTKDLGLTLATISIVETRAGKYLGNTKNRICGSHQVDVTIVKKNLETKQSIENICKAVRYNYALSSMVALGILSYWKDNTKSYKQMVLSYNRGWNNHSHDKEYWNRFTQVIRVLKNKGY